MTHPGENGEDRLLRGLDPQQAEVVLHRDGPALVVAGAGAGKTTTLVRRTAALLRAGVDPRTILLLTFTRAAAKSILDRARAFAAQADQVQGGTFHSIAARLIRDNHAMFGLPANFTVLDPSDVEDAIKRLMAERPLGPNGPRASTVAKIVSFSVNTCRDIDDVVIDRHPKYAGFAEAIRTLADAYVAYKKERFILDFDDLLLFFAAMAEHEAAGPMLRRKFRYVMCDEVQDNNALQMRIIFALGRDGGNVMAVGDPSQSIYGFRGAAPGTMYEIQRHWPDTRLLLIETNYRSTPEVVACADRVDRSMGRRIDRRLAASRPSLGVKPVIHHVDDREAESRFIAQSILDRRGEEGVPWREQAVLVRSMRHLRHVEVALVAHGIPTVVRGGVRIHEAGHVKDVLSVLRIVCNLADEPAWLRFLCMMPKVGEKTAVEIARTAIATGSLAGAVETLRGLAMKKRPSLALAAKALLGVSFPMRPADAVASVRDNLEGLFQARYEDDWDMRRKDIEAIGDIAAAQDDLEEFIRTLTIDVSVDRRDSGPPDEEGVVTLATIHSAKGLEWGVVYMPSFMQGHLPTGFSDPSDDPDEERRLMYVLVTRAKDELVLVRPRQVAMKDKVALAMESAFEPLIRDLATVVRSRPQQARGPALGGGILINVR